MEMKKKKILKGSKTKTTHHKYGEPKISSWFFSKNFIGQKEVAEYI